MNRFWIPEKREPLGTDGFSWGCLLLSTSNVFFFTSYVCLSSGVRFRSGFPYGHLGGSIWQLPSFGVLWMWASGSIKIDQVFTAWGNTRLVPPAFGPPAEEAPSLGEKKAYGSKSRAFQLRPRIAPNREMTNRPEWGDSEFPRSLTSVCSAVLGSGHRAKYLTAVMSDNR